MGAHHTKDKGDIGLLKVMADMREKGFIPCVPMTEHSPFDFIAYKDMRFERIQAKYRAVDKNGTITFKLSTSWADKHGNHSKPYKAADIDVFGVYCPDTKLCYYIKFSDVVNNGSVVLRVTPAKNNQQIGVNLAENYLDIPD